MAQTSEYLSDYWPGQNVLGQILMELQSEICDIYASPDIDEVSLDDNTKKCKAQSPLVSDISKVVQS